MSTTTRPRSLSRPERPESSGAPRPPEGPAPRAPTPPPPSLRGAPRTTPAPAPSEVSHGTLEQLFGAGPLIATRAAEDTCTLARLDAWAGQIEVVERGFCERLLERTRWQSAPLLRADGKRAYLRDPHPDATAVGASASREPQVQAKHFARVVLRARDELRGLGREYRRPLDALLEPDAGLDEDGVREKIAFLYYEARRYVAGLDQVGADFEAACELLGVKEAVAEVEAREDAGGVAGALQRAWHAVAQLASTASGLSGVPADELVLLEQSADGAELSDSDRAALRKATLRAALLLGGPEPRPNEWQGARFLQDLSKTEGGAAVAEHIMGTFASSSSSASDAGYADRARKVPKAAHLSDAFQAAMTVALANARDRRGCNRPDLRLARVLGLRRVGASDRAQLGFAMLVAANLMAARADTPAKQRAAARVGDSGREQLVRCAREDGAPLEPRGKRRAEPPPGNARKRRGNLDIL
jgi:hypothetical protein